jgi:hypothetical protein
MQQLTLFNTRKPPTRDYLCYLADLMKLRSKPKDRDRLQGMILRKLRPDMEELALAMRTGDQFEPQFEPWVDPELVLFYSDEVWDGGGPNRPKLAS